MEIEALINTSSPEVQLIFRKLRALIFEYLPNAIEEIDLQASMVGYMIAPGYKGTVFTLILARNWVTMGFSHGVALPDPERLLTGTGKVHKLIRFTESSSIPTPALNQLINEAVKAANMRQTHNGLRHVR